MRRPTRPEMKNLHDTDPVVVQITSARDTTALMGLLIQDKLVGFNFNHSSSIHSLATTTEDGDGGGQKVIRQDQLGMDNSFLSPALTE